MNPLGRLRPLLPISRWAVVLYLNLNFLTGCTSWGTGGNFHRLIFLGRPLDAAQSGLIVDSAIPANLVQEHDRRLFAQAFEAISNKHGLVDISQTLKKPSHIIRKFKAPGREFYAELCVRAEGRQLYVHLWEVWSPIGRSPIGRKVETEMIDRLKTNFGPLSDQ